MLVDTRRLTDSFPAVDYFEQRNLPFVIGVNCFDGQVTHPVEAIREALAVGPGVPIVLCDARVRDSAKNTLIELVEHAVARATAAMNAAHAAQR